MADRRPSHEGSETCLQAAEDGQKALVYERFKSLSPRGDVTMYAVFGATGNTGRATVRELQALGEDPLCIVRNPAKAQEVLGADVRTAVAEITDRPAMEKALKGVKRVFVVTGHNPQSGEQQINILEAAKAVGVKCNVLSVEHEHPYQGIIDTAQARGCDLIVMASHGRSGMPALVLGSQTVKVLTHSKLPVLVYR